jgi:hypothetical protein
MSNFITTHKATELTGKSVAFDGQRLAKVTWKTTAKVTAPMANQCVSVPRIQPEQVQEEQAALYPFIVAMLEESQDSIMRGLLLAKGAGCEIQDSEISIAACLAEMAEVAKGNRLSKDSIAAWFDSEAVDMLTIAVADKLGISDTPSEAETKKVAAIVADYSTKLQALSGSKTSYSPEVAIKLQRALEVAEVLTTPYGAMFHAKLEAMKVKPQADMLGL